MKYVMLVDKSAALEVSSVSSDKPADWYGCFGRIDSSAATGTYYLQVYDSSTVPLDGVVNLLLAPRKYSHTNGQDTLVDIDLRSWGIEAQNGISWGLSTTEFTKTIHGVNVVSLNSLYNIKSR